MTAPTLTFACYNQLSYTQGFIASLDRAEVDFSRIVAVDNGSSDGTRDWLAGQGFGAVILNQRNLGCGAAWNQGALAIQSEWTVVMNNDVICAPGWLRGMLEAARAHQLQIVSPAMIEGELGYNLTDLVTQRTNMSSYCRAGSAHAVCMMIHESVWEEIGYFMPVPKLLGYEDTIFFQRAREAGIRMGTTADAWLHHFGETTQKAMKLERKLTRGAGLGDRQLFKTYLNQSWLDRKLAKRRLKMHAQRQLAEEMTRFGASIYGQYRADASAITWL